MKNIIFICTIFLFTLTIPSKGQNFLQDLSGIWNMEKSNTYVIIYPSNQGGYLIATYDLFDRSPGQPFASCIHESKNTFLINGYTIKNNGKQKHASLKVRFNGYNKITSKAKAINYLLFGPGGALIRNRSFNMELYKKLDQNQAVAFAQSNSSFPNYGSTNTHPVAFPNNPMANTSSTPSLTTIEMPVPSGNYNPSSNQPLNNFKSPATLSSHATQKTVYSGGIPPTEQNTIQNPATHGNFPVNFPDQHAASNPAAPQPKKKRGKKILQGIGKAIQIAGELGVPGLEQATKVAKIMDNKN